MPQFMAFVFLPVKLRYFSLTWKKSDELPFSRLNGEIAGFLPVSAAIVEEIF